ncbi:MAG: hypothetical protein H6739_35745 [Alphaproteobacteria bacterium]|nr:hypothetical protein [Alphaproteobacteria bacterium]
MTRALFALTALIPVLVACEDSEIAIQASCHNYCDQRSDCDGDVDYDSCVSECEADINDCQADEVSATLDDMDACADKACDEMGACEIGAELQCHFGI